MLMIAAIVKINMLHRGWLISALSDLLVAQQAITLKRPQAGGLWHHKAIWHDLLSVTPRQPLPRQLL
ncbi:MAG: hypothetical protein CMK78_07590 [Pseudomonadales bacterium]|nr:hypothetical protein [Pseudomonadales bacterium]